MPRRLPGSMQTRHNLSDLIEGRLSSPEGRNRRSHPFGNRQEQRRQHLEP